MSAGSWGSDSFVNLSGGKAVLLFLEDKCVVELQGFSLV